MTPHPATNTGETFNELDPHGAEGHGQHASHVIVGPLTLRTILAILLVLTVATVGLAQAEVAIQNAFHIELPWWVNVAVAMSIAVVKALLVMAFFMQLKYDNPINSVLMLFTFGALAIFLFFSGLDLFSRGEIDQIKVAQITPGGTGKQVKGTGDKPLVVAARERMMERLKERAGADEAAAAIEFARIEADIAGHGHGEGSDHLVVVTDASHSRPRLGVSDALLPVAQKEHGRAKPEENEHAPGNVPPPAGH